VNAAVRPATTLGFVELFAAAAEGFAVNVAWSDLRARVPGCPDWTAYDLVVHLGNVHAWAATIVETGRPAAEQNDEPRSAKPRVVSEWYAGKAEDLYEVLRAAPVDRAAWNFAYGAGVAAFWQRRQVHETNIHRLDLDLASGRAAEPVDARVAADGVDEVLTVFGKRMAARGHPARLDRPLTLTATDTGDTWLVSPPTRGHSSSMVPAQPSTSPAEQLPVDVRRGAAAHDRAGAARDRVEGPAETLYRLLWRRAGLDDGDVRLEGDEARVRAFLGSRLVP
jgi:uncharacterized protein (TIGR03083 family)